MNKNTALKTASVIFLLMALAQLSRVILRFRVIIGENTPVPIWINLVAFVAMLALAAWMFQAARNH